MSLTLLANHDYSQCYVSSKNSLFLINSEISKSLILDYIKVILCIYLKLITGSILMLPVIQNFTRFIEPKLKNSFKPIKFNIN